MIKRQFRNLKSLVLALLCCSAAASLPAEISLKHFFGSNGVLQRDKAVPIWGKATPGETVTVEFADQSVTATADKNGQWSVTLAAMPVSTEGRTLVIRGSHSQPVELSDIVVGDVWLCSGQSNMAWTVQDSDNFEEELAAADYPLIRYFRAENNPSTEPQDTVPASSWKITRPGTNYAGDNPSNARVFSAVAYFFARDYFNATGIPVGLVVSARGGTPIESWMSIPSMQESPWWSQIEADWQTRLARYQEDLVKYEQRLAEWQAAADAAVAAGTEPPAKPRRPEVIPNGRFMPGSLYNGMIHPLFPMAIRGILWYQGESNAKRHQAYADLLPIMIRDWRNSFKQGDVPFYLVQLANFVVRNDATDQTWAFLREAQMKALSLPNTGVALAIDVGNPSNIHPGNKQAVGNRLARLALAHLEGIDIEWSGPTVESIAFSPDAVTVSFSHADGLQLVNGAPDTFLLAGDDRVFHPAEVVVDGTTITVSSPQVSNPAAIRYNWSNNPQGHLYNSAGLPASPFRSDDWPAK